MRSRSLRVVARTANHAAPKTFVLGLLLVALACIAAPARAANLSNQPIIAPGRGLPFAVADFDGDHQPDVASVQAAPGTSSSGDYWVRLRLSESGKRYIQLSAPRGGLLVEALDVNGDHAVDLVFATAWLDRPVAILLNDGHGNFSRVDPSKFPRAFTKSATTWNHRVTSLGYGLGLPQESPVGDFCLACSTEALRAAASRPRFAEAQFLPAAFLIRIAGRAPPAAIPL
ncbi:MAG TPA: VCBS repeat-containing protein [Candidatus Aquilonibacter sp.]|nr:VCBS repeat-containing protein [Candidatus Aquilonibacter sp.]